MPPRRLTRSGQVWSRGRAQPVQEELEIRGPGGKIQAFVLSPPNTRKRRLPTIIEIHGGPTWAWGRSPNHDTKMWPSAGYRVVRPNIRGSYNRRPGLDRAAAGRLGRRRRGRLPRRARPPGQSGAVRSEAARVLRQLGYGGFMVNWLVGTSSRFAAGVSSNGVANQVAAFANSDFGP